MKPEPSRGNTALRGSAEARLRANPASRKPQAEVDARHLQHELEVHQIELEMQNEELCTARAELETGLERYTDLFDFAPVGYFNLNAQGDIQLVNLTGAKLVGLERARLTGRRFGSFVAAPDRRVFTDCLARVFATQTRQTCEVALAIKERPPIFARLEVMLSPDGKEGRVVVVDITERQRAEATLAGTGQTLAAVTEALAAYVERGDWKEAMGRLLRCAIDQTQSEYGFTGVVVGSTLRVLAHEGIVWDKHNNREFYEQALRDYEKVGYLEFTSFNNLFGRAITTGKVVIANMPDTDPRSAGRPTGHPPMRSFLGVPILVGEQVQGMVALANRPGGYSEDEQRRIETLVQHAGGLCTSYRQREAAVVLEQTQKSILNALPAHIALLDNHGVIIAVNDSWRRFASANVLQSSDFFVGQNYLNVCDRATGDCSDEAAATAEGIRRVLRREIPQFAIEYPCHSPAEKRWFRLMATPVSEDSQTGAVVMHVNVTERRAAQEILIQQEREQRQLAEKLTTETRRLHESQAVAHVGSWETDLTTLEVTWTEETFRIFETTPEEFKVTHQGFLERVHPEDRRKVDDAFKRSIGQPGPFVIEHRLLFPDGRIKFVEERWQTFKAAAGRPVRAVGTCQDITKRKQAEAALAQSEANRRAVWKSSIDAIITMDESGNITDFNPAAEKVFGYQAADVIGHSMTDKIIPPALREEHRRGLAKFLATGQGSIMGRRIELSALRSDGTEFPVELAVVSVTGAERPTFLGTVRDITERKRAEEALRASEANMAAAQRVSHFGSWELDMANRNAASDLPLRWSDEMFRIAGYEPGEVQVTRELFYRRVHPEDREMLRQAVAKAIRERGPYALVHRLILPSGEERLVQQSAQVFFDEKSGQPLRIVGTTHDITEQRKSEMERERLFNLSLDMLCVASFDGVFLQVNPAWTKHLGWTAEELTNRPSLDFVHPEDQEATQQTRAQIVQGQPVRGFENRYRCKDGAWRWLSWNVHPFVETRQVFGVARDITEQRHLAEQLEVGRARLIAAQSVGKVGSWETDLATLSVIWSAEMHRIFETDPATFHPTHQRFLDLVHPEDRALVDEGFVRSLSQGASSAIEHRLRLPEGRVKFVEERWQVFRDQAGKPVRALGTCQDITERKRAERAVTISEASLARAQRVGRMGNWDWNIVTGELYWSAQIFELFGIDPANAPGTSERFFNAVHPEDRERIHQAVMAAVEGGAPYGVEHRVLWPDGTVRVMHEQGEVTRDAAGRPLNMVGTVQDITERKQVEAALRENEERFRGLFDQSAVGMCLASIEGQFLRTNQRFCEIVGYSAEELLQRDCVATTHPEDRAREAAIIAEMFAEKVQTAVWEKRYIHKAGHAVWCNVTLSLLPGREGQARQFVGVIEDITERRAAIEQLREREELLRIAGNVARLGGWSVDFPEVRITWSEELCVIHDMPAGTVPTLDQALGFCTPDSRPVIEAVFSRCARDGTPFDVELEVLTAKARRIWVRAIGKAERDAAGVITRVQGAFQDITGLKAAEEKARSSSERLAQTLESITDGFFTLDRDWHITYFNAEAERLLNCSRSAQLGRTLWEAFPGVVGTAFEREYRRAAAGSTTTTFEEYYAPFDRWFEIKAYPTAEGLAVYFRDVTESRRINAALRASESKFRQLAESDILGLQFWSAQGNISDANDAFLQMVGYTREELASGQIDWRSMTPPEYLPADERALQEIAATGTCTPFEKEYFHKDGRRVAILIGAAALDGAKDRGICYVVDISQQKKAVAALRVSEERFRLLANATNDAIWDWNLSTNELWWNEGYGKLFGYSRTEVDPTLKSWTDHIHPEDLLRVTDGLHHVIEHGGDDWSDEYRFRCQDGRYSHVLDRGHVTRNEAGQLVRMTGGMTDVTKLKEHEIALTQSNRALQLLSRCNEALIRSETESGLLATICRIAVDIGGFRLAWVGYAREDAAKTIEVQSHAGGEEDYLSKLCITWAENEPAGQGPAGKVIRHGEPVVIPDLETDESFRPWLEAARARGFRGVIALPLRDQKRTFGVLVLYLPEARQPLPDEMRLLRELADDMAFGIGHLRAQRESERIQTAVLKVATAVSASTGTEFFERLAGNMAEVVGAAAGFVAELLPDDPPRARIIAGMVDGKRAERFDYAVPGTPCVQLLEEDECVFSDRVASLFPASTNLASLGALAYVGRRLTNAAGQKIGLLYVLFREPLADTEFITATLRIFAARAASEMERKRADASVREQAALLDKAQEAILVTDLEGRITYWNKSADRLYGWTAQQAVGGSARKLICDGPGDYDSAMAKLIAAGEWFGELAQVTTDGRKLMVEGRWTLVNDDSGRPKSVLVINTDITERKNLEQQFLRAQRLESIGTLAGGIAHDLNNLLAPILMSVPLLRRNETKPQSQQIITIIERCAERGISLVKQVLSFARGVEGLRVSLELKQVIREVEAIAQSTFPKSITFITDLPQDLWPVCGDPTQLNQVFLNLCVNARDALANGGTITVSAANTEIDAQYAAMNREIIPGRYVVVTVADTGVGIPRQIIDRIFEPFFTTKEHGRGTGLGLSTVVGIVRSHGGSIDVCSEPGRGTTFRVHLPVTREEPPSGTTEGIVRREEDVPRGNGELILVVDDEETILSVTRQALEAFGYTVATAVDGAQAIGIYATRRAEVAVVITDMMMPIMDGPALIAALRRINPDVKIIGAGGLTANFDITRLNNSGVRHFLPKPYSATVMLRTLQEILAGV